MGFKVEEKFRIILVMKEVNLTNGGGMVSWVLDTDSLSTEYKLNKLI